MAASPPLRRRDVRLEALPDGSAMVYDPRTRMAYALTASAALVWEACDGAVPVDAIVDRLASVYDAPPDGVARDTVALLDPLTSLGLLEPGSGTGA